MVSIDNGISKTGKGEPSVVIIIAILIGNPNMSAQRIITLTTARCKA